MFVAEQRMSDTLLPGHMRYLCLAVMVFLLSSVAVEMGFTLCLWWQGELFPAIVSGYQHRVAVLQNYTIPGDGLVYAGTLLLDLFSQVPYYLALVCAAVLFWRFYNGQVWVSQNITLLKTIGVLIIFDALFPLLCDPLQILLFSWHGRPILQISFGINSAMVRAFIIGFSVCVFSAVVEKAKKMEEESRLII